MRTSDECYFGVLLFIVFLWAILHCRRSKSSHVDDNNDHGIPNDDDHVIITIKNLTGINPSVLRSIPIVDFNSKDFKDGVECVICLSEFVDEDKARVLPTCNHMFHVDCIDSWFLSQSTCPICRQIVCSEQPTTRPELVVVGDEGLTQIHDSRSENRGIPTDSSPMTTTEAAAVEDPGCGGANEGSPDLSAVVIDSN